MECNANWQSNGIIDPNIIRLLRNLGSLHQILVDGFLVCADDIILLDVLVNDWAAGLHNRVVRFAVLCVLQEAASVNGW